LLELREAYDKQRQNFDSFNFNFPFEAIWDDHDYGLNDAGKEYIFKEDAEQLFLDFWNIPEDDIRRTRPGLYFEWIENIDGIEVQMLFLDTRYFRDALLPTDERGAAGKERYLPQTDTSTSMLGDVQWNWLEQKMATEVDHRIIVSSIQFLAMGHGWEAWKTLPHERQRLIDLIDQSSSDTVLFISGDRHRAGLYQLSSDSGKNIFEMTSSSLNLSFTNEEEAGPLRIGPTFVDENYGEILLNKLTNKIIVNLKDNQGKVVQSLSL
jgi:alkaline phosphatase D